MKKEANARRICIFAVLYWLALVWLPDFAIADVFQRDSVSLSFTERTYSTSLPAE
jgi:hypothetical protein